MERPEHLAKSYALSSGPHTAAWMAVVCMRAWPIQRLDEAERHPIFGDSKHRRCDYNLVDNDALPIFRIGITICARKSVLLQWIAVQEGTS